jgi:hypothetical protein
MTKIEKELHWRQRISDYKNSNVPCKVWCEANGERYHALQYWIRKLGFSNQQLKSQPKDYGFVQILPEFKKTDSPTTPTASNILLTLGDYSLSVSDDFSEMTLRRLILVLKEC